MDKLKIYIDRLKNGQETYHERVPADFLNIQDPFLSFREDIQVKGTSYATKEHLISHLNIETSAFIPCCICNEMIGIPIIMKNLYVFTPLEEIKTAIFDLSEEIRELILLDIPRFVECNNGNCPDRIFMQQFLNKKKEDKKKPCTATHFPFSEL